MKLELENFPLDESPRKFTIEFECEDFYNLDETLSVIISACLKEFRWHMTGFPGEFSSMKEWEKQLDEMIYSFESIQDQFDSGNQYGPDHNKRQQKIDEGLQAFAKYFQTLWT